MKKSDVRQVIEDAIRTGDAATRVAVYAKCQLMKLRRAGRMLPREPYRAIGDQVASIARQLGTAEGRRRLGRTWGVDQEERR
jgi:hypothetical protein